MVTIVKREDPETMIIKGLRKLDINISQKKIVIKPNLITNNPYPSTTSSKTFWVENSP